MKTTLFLLVLCMPMISLAQSTYSIAGIVSDTNGIEIETGNVILLSPDDSLVIKGTIFWDGKFELYGIDQQDVLLKITASGYKTTFKQIQLRNDGLTNIGNISLPSDALLLEGVDVVYKKPMFEREIGKLVVNVEETILSERGTVIDLLRSAPNVIVRSDNSISVVGKGAAIIYLDGQRINSIELLSGISSRDIARIEVIENPSAKYDAEGSAVIEIFTKQGAMDGYQGSLAVNGTKRTDEQLWYRGQISFRKKWFSLYCSGGQFLGTLHENEIYNREVFGSPLITMENFVDKTMKYKFNTWLYIDTDFRIDSLNTVFVNYNLFRPNMESNILNRNTIYEDGLESGSLNSVSQGEQSRWVHSISAGYHRSLDTLGSELRFTGQYSMFDLNSASRISQESNFGSILNSEFRSDNYNNIDVYAAQLDYVKRFAGKQQLSAGVKNSLVTNGSGVNFEYFDGTEWFVDSSLYNQFDYQENILAGYTEFSGRIKDFSYKAGLRYEWTKNDGNSLLAGEGVFSRDYHNIFPNVQLGFDITPDLIVGLTYNNRIRRPSYQDLDPFVDFIDSLSSFRGNPQLRPAYSHNVEASLIYMEYASIKLGYTHIKDPMFLTVQKDELTNSFSAIVENIDYSETFSIGLVIPYELDWWTTFNAVGYDFNMYTYRDNSTLLVSNEPTWYVSLYNEFRIPKVCNIELTYEYVDPGSQGIFVANPYQSLGGSISRKFFKDQLTVRFSAFDILFTEIESAESRLEEFNVKYTSRTDTRAITLGLTWNFGKLKDDSMRGKTIDDSERDRIKED